LWATNNADRGATFFMMLNPADPARLAETDFVVRSAIRADIIGRIAAADVADRRATR
jgi:hypothetical protein